MNLINTNLFYKIFKKYLKNNKKSTCNSLDNLFGACGSDHVCINGNTPICFEGGRVERKPKKRKGGGGRRKIKNNK
jgi:hypothetical protein